MSNMEVKVIDFAYGGRRNAIAGLETVTVKGKGKGKAIDWSEDAGDKRDSKVMIVTHLLYDNTDHVIDVESIIATCRK